MIVGERIKMEDRAKEQLERTAKKIKETRPIRIHGCSVCRKITGTTLRRLPGDNGYICQVCFDRRRGK